MNSEHYIKHTWNTPKRAYTYVHYINFSDIFNARHKRAQTTKVSIYNDNSLTNMLLRAT